MKAFGHALVICAALCSLTPCSFAQAESPQQAVAKLERLVEQNQVQPAIDSGNVAVAQWPGNAQMHHLLGLAYFKAGDLTGAGEHLAKAVNLAPRQADMQYDLALVRLSERNYPAAAEHLELANRLDPKNALAHVLLGRAYLNTNRTLQAIPEFQQALRLEPNIELGHYHLGFAYESLGKNDEAIAEYNLELVRDPASAETLYQLGHTLLESGKLNDAEGALRRCLAHERRFDAEYDLGKTLLLEHKVSESITTLRKAIELNSGDPSVHYQLARALEISGRKQEAEQELARFRTLKAAQPSEGGMASGRVIK